MEDQKFFHEVLPNWSSSISKSWDKNLQIDSLQRQKLSHWLSTGKLDLLLWTFKWKLGKSTCISKICSLIDWLIIFYEPTYVNAFQTNSDFERVFWRGRLVEERRPLSSSPCWCCSGSATTVKIWDQCGKSTCRYLHWIKKTVKTVNNSKADISKESYHYFNLHQ